MADLSKLSPAELDELIRLLEDESIAEPPTVVFTVVQIASDETRRTLPAIYPIWWHGWDWWNALPASKRRELIIRNGRN